MRDADTAGRTVADVKIPDNVTWWVADRGAGIHACVGIAFVHYGQSVEDFDILITDIYCDYTREGMAALAAILRQAATLPYAITTIVPLDRIQLGKLMLKDACGGFQPTGIEFSKPRSVAAKAVTA